MEPDMIAAVVVFSFISFIIGMCVGVELAKKAWENNADTTIGMEDYKVVDLEFYYKECRDSYYSYLQRKK